MFVQPLSRRPQQQQTLPRQYSTTSFSFACKGYRPYRPAQRVKLALAALPEMAADVTKSDAATGSTSGSSSSSAVAITTRQNFDDMLTLLGGLDDSCLRGYVGQWRTWAPPHTSSNTGSSNTECNLLQELVNFRLFQLKSTEPPEIRQVNIYQVPNTPAKAYTPYLSKNETAGRSDGCGVREWTVKPVGTLWETDATSWLTGQPGATPPEATLLGLSVRDCSLGLFNGGLPCSSEESADAEGSLWYMEAINKVPGSNARRWGLMLCYDSSGELKNMRTMSEDLTQMTPDIENHHIDPKAVQFRSRGERLPVDIDSWVSQRAQAGQAGASIRGTSTTFSYNAQHHLTKLTHPCTWNSNHVTQQYVTQAFPDGMYIRAPRSIAQQATADPVVTIELGAALSDGHLVRWLVKYENGGQRLLREATFELYPAAAVSST